MTRKKSKVIATVRRLLKGTILTCVFIFCTAGDAATARSVDDVALEYQVKASMIYNFLHYVQWPADAFENSVHLSICVFGSDPFGSSLDTLSGEVIQGRRIQIRYFYEWSESIISECHVLFFNSSRSENMRALQRVKDFPVLTIGEDSRYFLNTGGIIYFLISNNRVQFEVNNLAARNARLQLSSKLLRLARSVIAS